jgi:hypothetical protein
MINARLDLVNANIKTADPRPYNIAEELEEITEWATSPSQKHENRLHGTVAFFIMPVLLWPIPA